ncbi:hypothetical protein [Stenotrophomonas maltophilia]|uniref:hypothetical protein n=1 Tax=Stenotrophomonas maltophilia TaxID=40324 RepID=UPI0012B24126|nr:MULTISPECIES: hypothetical protein [Stenotrophomonas]MBH1540810.1 hypothetical protein [Stenotrophomonas maltophilia]MBN4983948.1 hypothetical protein [Stenotrophomonas maltophilia]
MADLTFGGLEAVNGAPFPVFCICSPMKIIDPVLSELLSRLGVDTDFGDTVLTCPET